MFCLLFFPFKKNSDPTRPVISYCPPSIEIDADDGDGALSPVFEAPTANDPQDGDLEVPCTLDVGSSVLSPDGMAQLPLGDNDVTCTVMDDDLNTPVTDCTFTITVAGTRRKKN